MKSIITFEQLVAFTRYNHIRQYRHYLHEPILPGQPFILQRFGRFCGVQATYFLLFQDGVVSLFPEHHPEFAKTIGSLPELVERIQQDCHIETTLPPEL